LTKDRNPRLQHEVIIENIHSIKVARDMYWAQKFYGKKIAISTKGVFV